jgi:hypothetical protein
MRIAFVVAAVLTVLVRADLALAQTPQQRIDAATAHAREAGIPVTLLESKVAEGKAKGIPMDRIAAAVERRESALERASQALRGRPNVTAADLSVGADAVESGVSAAVLKTLAETAPKDRRVVAIAALTELVRQGRVPDAALERVRDALKRGPDALANLPAQAAEGARGNGRPDGQPDSAGGRGRGQGPPASVPAPGSSTQPTKPGGKPTEQPTKAGGKPTEQPTKPGGKPTDAGKPKTTPAPAGRGQAGGV